MNRKPCCGDVAPIAATVVEPGRSIEVTVRLKMGLAAGQVVHLATIETEGGDESGAEILTTATAHARVTFEEIGPAVGPLDPGHPRRVEFLIRSFGLRGDPPPPLDDRAIRCELSTEWEGVQTSRGAAEPGLDETRRTLAVTLPGSGDLGAHSAPLEVLDGHGAVVGRRWIGWEVASLFKASPSGLVFAADAQAAAGLKVIVRCRDGRPFRITSATTELARMVVEVDGDAARPAHQLVARLDGPRPARSGSGAIVIRTDQPDQPFVKVAVYVAGREAGAAPRDAKEALP